jgi:cytochrome P450
MMIAMHKNVQEKAFQEVESFFESCGDDMTLNDVGNLPYLDWIMKETMRLFPPVPFPVRSSTGNVELGKMII